MGKIIAILGFVALVIGGSIWWAVYSYKDCKKVGHSTLYCVLKAGK